MILTELTEEAREIITIIYECIISALILALEKLGFIADYK